MAQELVDGFYAAAPGDVGGYRCSAIIPIPPIVLFVHTLFCEVRRIVPVQPHLIEGVARLQFELALIKERVLKIFDRIRIHTALHRELLRNDAGVVAMLNAGAGIGIASLAIGAVLCGFIFLLSLHYGTRDIKIFDTVCLIAALGVLGIYIFLRDPLFSIIAVATIDFIGFMPTLRKAYIDPHSETASNYALSAFSSLLALGALQVMSVTTALYLVSLVITNGACAAIIIMRRKR